MLIDIMIMEVCFSSSPELGQLPRNHFSFFWITVLLLNLGEKWMKQNFLSDIYAVENEIKLIDQLKNCSHFI